MTIIANEYEVEEFSKKIVKKMEQNFFGHDFLLRVGTKYFFLQKKTKKRVRWVFLETEIVSDEQCLENMFFSDGGSV